LGTPFYLASGISKPEKIVDPFLFATQDIPVFYRADTYELALSGAEGNLVGDTIHMLTGKSRRLFSQLIIWMNLLSAFIQIQEFFDGQLSLGYLVPQ
jgi:hypothetical protein